MSSLAGLEQTAGVSVRFFAPHERLKPYISTLYLTEVRDDAASPNNRVADYLHPEWANVRFFDSDNTPIGAVGLGSRKPIARVSVSGPTSKATYFAAAPMRMWGIGILPLGWLKFVESPALDYTDRARDGEIDPVFADFAPVRQILFGCADYNRKSANAAAEAEAINTHLLGLLDQAKPDDKIVARTHAILVDPDLTTVHEMADRLSITGRTLDRLCKRAFGFAPKLLLRRQRFLRSLSENMLSPDKNWISTLDPQYYDQAHFTRDFKDFMGMSASEYKALPHPFMNAAVHARLAAAGAGMQVLHDPEGNS